MIKRAVIAVSIALGMTSLALASAPASSPRADASKGNQLYSAVCAACHGADGNSTISANPKLAGQHPEYLVKQLNNFRPESGASKPLRENAVMAGFAASLSVQDMQDIAAYLSAQKPKLGAAKNKDTLELGQKIYRGGIAEKSVPACAGCHSPNGAGIPAQYPRLAGQHAEYTEAQLVAYRSGARANGPMMKTIAARLSDAEIKALSDYIAGLR